MKAVLLFIDLQEDFLRAPRPLLPARERIIRRAATLLSAFRRRALPVIHVWTTVSPSGDRRFPHWPADAGKCIPGTPGHQPPEPLRPVPGEPIVHKQGFNPFAGGDLEAHLAKATKHAVVVLAGVHLHACIRTAAVECLERGYRVVVAEDAVGSYAPLHAATTQRWLSERCSKFVPVAACIAGLDGRPSGPYEHRSPRHPEEVCFRITDADSDQVRTATMSAREARSRWAVLPPETRRECFANVAALLRSRAPALAHRMAVEIGKPISHGLEEVLRAAANVEDVVRRVQADIHTASPAAQVRRCPLGLVAIITPWNNPIAIPIGKIVPAIIYGNAVVWKPAPAGTGLARELVRILDEAGFPRELALMVEGDTVVARALATLDTVDAVTITGSLSAGLALQEICADRSVPLQAELGGNNAAIVWEDADLEAAAAQTAWGAMAFAGQRCTANRRVIVLESMQQVFLEALRVAARQLKWGDPLDPATEIGPVLSSYRREEIEGWLADAQSERHVQQLLYTHNHPELSAGENPGAYAKPVIAICPVPDQPLVQEELMAPLLVVQPAHNFDHAMSLCNGVRQGLAAALFSHSTALQQRFLREAQAGILKLNTSTAGADASLPFGGWKASGLGPPEHGEGDALFYQRFQTVYGWTGTVTRGPCRGGMIPTNPATEP